MKALHIIGISLLTIIRLWLGIQWFIAGIGKYINGFDAKRFSKERSRSQLAKTHSSVRGMRRGSSNSPYRTSG
ncbi:MAG TPA: hypothetical protein DD663_12670 [Exiguobacterium sp.]|nr:hypothetical protein [Exiguobacterium sp.]